MPDRLFPVCLPGRTGGMYETDKKERQKEGEETGAGNPGHTGAAEGGRAKGHSAVENFRRLPAKEIDAILEDSPEQLVEAVAKVLKAFLLKMNVPVPETERLADKVREKKMGELFADMDKIDIQAERRNTASEKQRADEAEKQAAEEKRRAEEAVKRADEEQRQAEEEQRRADEAERQAAEERRRADIAEENAIKLLIELSQEFGASMDAAMQSLMDKKNMTREEASEKVKIYWKEPTGSDSAQI